jgi:RsiW-degrading membrane proteinase PrsW (M82 family)
MFYCGMAASSFASIENIQYVQKYGIDVLITRSFLSVPIHMMCGFTVGYFISLGRHDLDKNTGLSELANRFGKKVYTWVGIFSAVLVHGFYDLNLFIDGPNVIFYLVFIVVLSFQLVKCQFKYLIEETNKIKYIGYE